MNRATRIITAVLGVTLAIACMTHGYFETLQGNTPTTGFLVDSVGQSMQTWAYGGDGAFTLIPNFLVTGIASIIVGLAIIVWSVGYIHTKHGATVFLLLFVLAFLVGGGVGQVLFFVTGWAFATRINKPLTWWRQVLPEGVRGVLARLWPWTMVAGSALFVFTLALSIFGFLPGMNDAPESYLNLIFAILLVGWAFYILTYIAGFAYDIEQLAAPQAIPTMTRRRV